jgi:signal transduction histidine kinase
MMTDRTNELDQSRRLERGLIAVRWFGVMFAALQVWQSANLEPGPPRHATPLGWGLVALLLVGNVIVTMRTRRATRADQMRRIGLSAFALDIAVTTGFIWNYSYSVDNSLDTTWVAAYILPLEGALRYQLNGALAAMGVMAVSEVFRELYLTTVVDGYSFMPAAITFRLGIGTIIALVAGFMARSLERQADTARDRARLAEEAARRATAARKELAAFHAAILAGVAAENLHETLQSMAEAIGRDLGFDCLSILLVEEEDLVARARYGTCPPTWGDRVPVGTGVPGMVAASGEPRLAPTGRAGAIVAAAPLSVGAHVIGVLEVASQVPGGVTEDTLDVLVRLADQLALVIHSADLRARQAETLQRLQELDEMKSDFVAITSHELRTPLTAVRGFVRTLIRNLDRLSSRQVADFLGQIDRQSDRLTRLVEDLLVVSRIEAGQISVTPEPVELQSFLREVVKAFGASGDRIELDLEADLPPSVVMDPHRVDQVITNLLQNAMKFSPRAAKVKLSARAVDHQIEFAVSDQGIGIAPEELAHIFDRFHQAAPALTREAEGAGLGLYITKRLVEAMAGDMAVTSELGKGSTFTVRLPESPDGQGPGDEETVAESPSQLPGAGRSPTTSPSGKAPASTAVVE